MSTKTIYVFLQAVTPQIAQWVAVSEDGHCLASLNLPINAQAMAKELLGPHSQYRASYQKYYPLGFQVQFIENINAPENYFLLNRIRETCLKKVAEAQAKGIYRAPGLSRGS